MEGNLHKNSVLLESSCCQNAVAPSQWVLQQQIPSLAPSIYMEFSSSVPHSIHVRSESELNKDYFCLRGAEAK